MQVQAGKIRRENYTWQGRYVLQHLRSGGWGAKGVSRPLQGLPYRHEEPGTPKAHDPPTIAERTMAEARGGGWEM